jgi:hypothetical protein
MIGRRRLPSVLVIVDREFGERLLHVEPGRPVWIVMSPTNDPAIQLI